MYPASALTRFLDDERLCLSNDGVERDPACAGRTDRFCMPVFVEEGDPRQLLKFHSDQGKTANVNISTINAAPIGITMINSSRSRIVTLLTPQTKKRPQRAAAKAPSTICDAIPAAEDAIRASLWLVNS